MEKKRYQVFVSSTYIDLKDARASVFDTLTKVDCIPVGMEAFPAFDEEQLSYIKSIIDDSDYYVLIIGGRYGSVTGDGVSFTESEYNYAIEKGIPVLSFIHGRPDSIPVGLTDNDVEKRERLNAFIKRAQAGRLVKEWNDINELSLRVTQAITLSMKTRPGIGWIRGSAAASVEILNELNELRKKHAELIEKLTDIETAESEKLSSNIDLAPLDTAFNIRIHILSDGRRTTYERELTWKQIFSIIGSHILTEQLSRNINIYLSTYLVETNSWHGYTKVYIAAEDINTIKVQLSALDYVKLFQSNDRVGDKHEYITLTDRGRRVLFEIRSVK